MRFGLDDPGREGEDAEGSGRSARDLAVIYLAAGEEDHAEAEAGNGQI